MTACGWQTAGHDGRCARGRRARDEAVTLEPYDDRWPELFEAEAVAIDQLIHPRITGGIHHVGSTSVPGLAAKPVIDIAVGVADLESSRPCIDLLADLEYQYVPYLAEDMRWFCQPGRSHRTHHLHLIPTGSFRYEEELAFPRLLRGHPAHAREYEELKRRLAQAALSWCAVRAEAPTLPPALRATREQSWMRRRSRARPAAVRGTAAG